MIEEWLVTALAWCDYAEDVHALEHFVFHARLNGMSNMCLLCMRPCSSASDSEHFDTGHLVDCPYLVALKRVTALGRETLTECAERLGKRTHEKRVLVCTACVKPEDFVFGGVHTDRKCGRCGVEPIGKGAVVASSPWAGGIPFG